MATHYLYGTVLTGEAVAANNRGDNIGNTTTLQKIFLKDRLHTSVSAEAIRFALRYRFQLEGVPVNRRYEDDKLGYRDEKRVEWDPAKGGYIDDDLMGFMDAAAAKKEKESELGEEAADEGTPATASTPTAAKPREGKKPKPQGKTTKRTSPLSVGRAVSLRPYRGEMSFNCVSGDKTKGKLSLYSAEIHTTEYQYSFGLNLGDVVRKENIGHLIQAIVDPPPVAGNHSRFAYDFSPASIVLRLTSAHSSRIQNCFDHNESDGSCSIPDLVRRVRSGDIPASELIVGGAVGQTAAGQELKGLGVNVLDGVHAAAKEARRRIDAVGGDYKGLAS